MIVNPAATSVGDQFRSSVVDALAGDHDVTVAETAARGDATALAARAAADGAEVVVSLGGDGTANETANGLAGSTTALAALPGGSTNVFPRTIGFPNDPAKATECLRAALIAGSRRRVGLGSAGGRRFLFHVGVGFDARVIELVDRHGWAKHTVGPLAFAGAGLAIWLARRDHPVFTVDTGSETIDGRFAIVLKTDPYTFLGPRPLTMAPEAGLGRPLAVVVLRDLGAATLLGSLCSALQDGRRLRELPGVALRTGLERVVVTAAHPVGHQADGEFLGETADLLVVHEPDCLDLVVPVGSHQ
ncbi:MAG: diacylglycerol kinase family protein [Acidimicrobiales bacterium]